MSELRESVAPAGLRQVWRTVLPQDARRAVTGAISPSGERVAVGFDGSGGFGHSAGSLAVLSGTAGEILRQINDDWQVHVVAYDPSGRFLVTSESRTHVGGPDERRVRVVDAETLGERCRYDEVTHGGWSEDLSFSRDGAWVAGRAGSFREITPMAYAFDAATGQPRWNRHYPNLYCQALAPGSGSLAVGYDQQTPGGPVEPGFDRGVAVLDSATGAERFRIRTTPFIVRSVAYSPDGRVIFAGCLDGQVHAYDAADGSPRWAGGPTVPDHSILAVDSMAVSDDGRWIAAGFLAWSPSGNALGLVAVLDAVHGTLRSPPVPVSYPTQLHVVYTATLRHVGTHARFGWPPVFGEEFGLAVIDARSGRQYGGAGGEIRHLASAPAGSLVATFGKAPQEFGTPSHGFVALYDLGIEVSRRDTGSVPKVLETSPGGTPLVALAGADIAGTGSAVTVLDAASGVPLAAKPVPGTVTSVVFADHGEAVAVGGSDGVRLFSIVGERIWKDDTLGVVNGLAAAGVAGEWVAVAAARTVRLLAATDGHGRWPSPTTHPQTVTRIAADGTGARVATGCADRGTRLLDAATGAATVVTTGDGRVQDLAFTLDGRLLATANQDGTVIVVDAATAAERSRATRPFGCSRIAFALDGTLLAAAWDDNSVTVHDLAGGESTPPTLWRLPVAAPVAGLAFNPANRSLAIAVTGAALTVYDSRDGAELSRILLPAPVAHFAFSADGALLATAGEDHVVRVWTSGAGPEVGP